MSDAGMDEPPLDSETVGERVDRQMTGHTLDSETAGERVDRHTLDTGQTEIQQTADEQASAVSDVSEASKKSAMSRRGRRGCGARRQAREYNCTSCSRSFSNRQDIATHQYMHRENPTSFCAVCNKSFSSESAYRRHTASHNRKSSRQLRKTCQQCDMQFDTMRQLSMHHAARHVDDKPFVCAICGSQFAWQENLKAHQRTHELDPHECDVCGRRFVDATSLRVHTRNSHGPSSAPPPAWKQHSCKLCGWSFQFDFSLRAHMKGHAQSPMTAGLRRARCYRPGITSTTTTDHHGLVDVNEVEPVKQPLSKLYSDSGTGQTLDLSDIIDQTSDTAADRQQDTLDSSADTLDTSASRLVWYVKPDTGELSGAGENQQQLQQQQQDEDSDTAPQQTLDLSDETDQLITTADQQLDTAASRLVWYVKPDACTNSEQMDQQQQQPDDDVISGNCEQSLGAADQHTDHVTAGDDDVGQPTDNSTQPLQPSEAATDDGQAVSEHSDDDDDEEEEEEEEEDEIDWMDVEPPHRRAAPFIFRATRSRQHRARPREPYLFNCVMTDEKPFACTVCGECFRWEISLHIHQRLHTDGTFPNKSRGARRPMQNTSRRRGKLKQTAPAPRKKAARVSKAASVGKVTVARSGDASVARSYIVRHRRTSSDEEDDEFTFHVHADGPTQVSTHYPPPWRRPPLGQGHGQGQGGTYWLIEGRGQGPAVSTDNGPAALLTSSTDVTNGDQLSRRRAGCNGIGREPQTSDVTVIGAQGKSRRVMLRAGLVCRRCRRVVTSRSALKRHQRRAHVTATLVCEFCSAWFTSRLDLQRHCRQTHDSDVEKCRRCQQVFTDSTQLRRHYMLHQATVKPVTSSA